MLMDNNGGASAVSGENGPILTPPEMAPNGEIENFEDFLNQENMPPAGERPVEMNAEAEAAVGEMASEAQSSAMPVAQSVSTDDADEEPMSPEVATLQSIEIQRDAEELPKEYVNGISEIIKKDKSDPHKLSLDLDIARWDLMKKAFGRKLGDGLNGTTAV